MPIETVTIEPKTQTLTFKSGQQITIEKKDVQVVVRGIQGPSGPPGEKGDAGSPGVETTFSFGDATPLVLTTASADKIIERVTVYLNVAFDGEAPSLQIGDAEQLDRIMTTTEVDPSEIAVYQVSPGFAYDSNTEILLSIDPGIGASQGSGLAVIEMQQ